MLHTFFVLWTVEELPFNVDSRLLTNINLKMILLDTKEKQTYVTPSIMLVEVKNEGVICTSPGEYPQWNPEDI